MGEAPTARPQPFSASARRTVALGGGPRSAGAVRVTTIWPIGERMSESSRGQGAGETVGNPADPASSSPHVLVIDDEHSIVDMIRIGLRLQGFAVDGARTGLAGLE